MKLVKGIGGKCHGYVVDLASREDIYRVAKTVHEEVGRVSNDSYKSRRTKTTKYCYNTGSVELKKNLWVRWLAVLIYSSHYLFFSVLTLILINIYLWLDVCVQCPFVTSISMWVHTFLYKFLKLQLNNKWLYVYFNRSQVNTLSSDLIGLTREIWLIWCKK